MSVSTQKRLARPLKAVLPVSQAVSAQKSMVLASADSFLRTAAATILDRGVQRDTSAEGAQQGRSMAATVAAFNALEGTSLTERQGWAFMQVLKLARSAASARNGQFNADDFVDGAAYAALAGESAIPKD
jgi:hypothetical protein